MCMVSSNKDLYLEYITLAPFVSLDNEGDPTYGTASEHRARVVDRPRLVRNVNGQEVVSMTTVSVFDYTIERPTPGEQGDQITLPDGRQPIIIGVESYPCDVMGHRHIRILT